MNSHVDMTSKRPFLPLTRAILLVFSFYLRPLPPPGGGTIIGLGLQRPDDFLNYRYLPMPAVAIQFGRGDGTFGPARHVAGEAYSSLVMLDLNRDGTPDLITTDPASDRLAIYASQAPGRFSSPSFVDVDFTPYRIATSPSGELALLGQNSPRSM
jgi:hypothetical protein